MAVCRKQRVFLQEGYMMKFHGAHVKIRELIDEGRLGKIVYVRAQLSCWYPKIAGAWRQDPKKGGGGALIDMASHLYDLIEYFAGPIRRIAALTGNLVQDYRSEDASTTLLELDSGRRPPWTASSAFPTRPAARGWRSTARTARFSPREPSARARPEKWRRSSTWAKAAMTPKQSKDVTRKFQRIAFPAVNPYTAECSYFADCILCRQPPTINDAKNAVRSMTLIEKAYAAAKSGRMRGLTRTKA